MVDQFTAFKVDFVNGSSAPVVYSTTEASTIAEGGNNTGSVSINANASILVPTR